MTISFPLSLPDDTFIQSIVLRRVPVVGVTQSPYDGTQQVQPYPGQWWEADVTLPNLNTTRSPQWEAFIGKLNGREGTFLLGDPVRPAPRGSASVTPGTPVVNGAHAARVNSVTIDGCPHGVTGYLKAGDYVQFGSGSSARLHQLLDDVDTDGSGNATLTLWPKTRTALVDNATVTVSGCKGVFRLGENAQSFERRAPNFTNFSFSCIEAL